MKQPIVMAVVGTRPEAVKMAPVIHALAREPALRLRVLATAQHREMLDQVLSFFEIRPDVDLDLMRPDQTLAGLTSRLIDALDRVFEAQAPDLVLAQGDTTTVMAAGLCCYYRRIAFGHVEAGLRTGAKYLPFPEEMNRSLVGRLADLHFAPTQGAAANLRLENTPPESIHVTGNTVIDALLWAVGRELPRDHLPPGGRPLILVTAHRRESFGEGLREIFRAVLDIAGARDVDVLYPVHPNPSVRRAAAELLHGHPRIHLVEPLDYPRFVAAMQACRLILTDSGGVQEEAPSLGKPILVLRDQTERPEGVAAGTALLVGPHREALVARALELLDDPETYARMAHRRNPYGDGKAAGRIVRAIGAFFREQAEDRP